jgi:hypothetical protein
MDPAIDPYNLVMKPSVYEPQTGQVRGSITDAYRSIRRAQDASRRATRDASASTQRRSSKSRSGTETAEAN